MRFVSGRDVSEDRKDLKRAPAVLALGLPRCATSSLQVAFERLGFKPCMHMAEVAPYADKLKLCLEAMELLYPDNFESQKVRRQKILHKLFDGWAATSDFPGMLFVEDLMDMYPDAKIILNQRNPETWSRSIGRTLAFFGSTAYSRTCYLWETDRLHSKIHTAYHGLGPKLYHVDSVFGTDAYEAHQNRVRTAAKQRNRPILEWQASEGWQPVCDLLDQPVPKDEPFPHANDEKTVNMVKKFLMVRGAVSWIVALGVPAVAVWIGFTRKMSLESFPWFRRG